MVDRYNRRIPTQRGFGAPAARSCMNNNNGATPPCNNGGGCQNGGNNNTSTDCKSLQRRLQTVEFSMYDTMLYLDIYPECKEALAYYDKLSKERGKLRETLARKCRRPMSAHENDGADGWDWIASPWPWDISAN